jgi:molybdenum-dependent DNA-binding transcriptional regulator ModE
MDWKELKELEINQQIDKFNELIKEHGSITKAAKELGISDSTTRKYFKPLGYSFNGNEYIKNTNTQLEGQTSLVEPANENKEQIDITELEQIVNRLIDKRLETLQQTNNPVEIELSSKCEGDVKYRSFGVYKNILDEFIKYADKHSRYSKVELVSQALILLMDHFK